MNERIVGTFEIALGEQAMISVSYKCRIEKRTRKTWFLKKEVTEYRYVPEMKKFGTWCDCRASFWRKSLQKTKSYADRFLDLKGGPSQSKKICDKKSPDIVGYV